MFTTHREAIFRGERTAYLERACWLLGGVLLLLFLGALLDGLLGRRLAIEQLNSPPPVTAAGAQAVAAATSLPAGAHAWSQARVQQYKTDSLLAVAPPVALLRIRRVALEVPVFGDDRELHLNRGAGLIPGMQLPGVGGNLGIAGHRDGFFRVLKDVRLHDLIEVQTRARVFSYRIVALDIVGASDTSRLADTLDPTITLVTCYPFYFVGHAPKRFIVRGTLESTAAIDTPTNVT